MEDVFRVFTREHDSVKHTNVKAREGSDLAPDVSAQSALHDEEAFVRTRVFGTVKHCQAALGIVPTNRVISPHIAPLKTNGTKEDVHPLGTLLVD